MDGGVSSDSTQSCASSTFLLVPTALLQAKQNGLDLTKAPAELISACTLIPKTRRTVASTDRKLYYGLNRDVLCVNVLLFDGCMRSMQRWV